MLEKVYRNSETRSALTGEFQSVAKEAGKYELHEENPQSTETNQNRLTQTCEFTKNIRTVIKAASHTFQTSETQTAPYGPVKPLERKPAPERQLHWTGRQPSRAETRSLDTRSQKLPETTHRRRVRKNEEQTHLQPGAAEKGPAVGNRTVRRGRGGFKSSGPKSSKLHKNRKL